MKKIFVSTDSNPKVPGMFVVGKLYEVRDYHTFPSGKLAGGVNGAGTIIAEDGMESYILTHGCSYLGGGNWRVHESEHTVPNELIKIHLGARIYWVKKELAKRLIAGRTIEYKTMLASIVIDTKTNEILKCRYSTEQIIDTFIANGNI